MNDDEREENENTSNVHMEMVPVRSTENLMLDTQFFSTDNNSEYGSSMYSPKFQITTSKNVTKLQYCCVFINHVMMQIAMLSILEPLLFFYYIVSMEKQLFYEQLDKFIIHSFNVLDDRLVAKIRSQVFYPLIFQFLEYENIYIDNFYNELLEDSNIASIAQEKLVESLFDKAIRFAIICNIVNTIYSFGTFYFYKVNLLEILMHHITLIFCIGLYEIWFFTNIVLKYLPWTKEEVLFYVFQCIWRQYSDQFPEMQQLQQNVTMVCDSH